MTQDLHKRYQGRVVQVDLNQAACQGLPYVGRLKATDDGSILLGYHTRLGIHHGDLEKCLRGVERAETKGLTQANRMVEEYSSAFVRPEVLLSKSVIARVVAYAEPTTD